MIIEAILTAAWIEEFYDLIYQIGCLLDYAVEMVKKRQNLRYCLPKWSYRNARPRLPKLQIPYWCDVHI